MTVLQRHLPRVASHPGLRPRIRRNPRDPLSVRQSLIGYRAEIAEINMLFLLIFFYFYNKIKRVFLIN